jgi:hypothetical protein
LQRGALAEAHGFVKDAESLALKSRRDELFEEIERLPRSGHSRGAQLALLTGSEPRCIFWFIGP